MVNAVFEINLQELRAAFNDEAEESDADRLLLSVNVAQVKDIIDAAYDVPGIAE